MVCSCDPIIAAFLSAAVTLLISSSNAFSSNDKLPFARRTDVVSFILPGYVDIHQHCTGGNLTANIFKWLYSCRRFCNENADCVGISAYLPNGQWCMPKTTSCTLLPDYNVRWSFLVKATGQQGVSTVVPASGPATTLKQTSPIATTKLVRTTIPPVTARTTTAAPGTTTVKIATTATGKTTVPVTMTTAKTAAVTTTVNPTTSVKSIVTTAAAGVTTARLSTTLIINITTITTKPAVPAMTTTAKAITTINGRVATTLAARGTTAKSSAMTTFLLSTTIKQLAITTTAAPATTKHAVSLKPCPFDYYEDCINNSTATVDYYPDHPDYAEDSNSTSIA